MYQRLVQGVVIVGAFALASCSVQLPGAPTASGSGPIISPPLSSMQMIDTKHGWATSAADMVLHTSDGAATWGDVTPPHSASESPGGFQGAFVSTAVAWVVWQWGAEGPPTAPAEVFLTTDGGHSWSHATVQTSACQLTALDRQHAWMLCDPEGAGAGSYGADIWRSTDGNRTWNEVESTSSSAKAPSSRAGTWSRS